MPYQSSGGRRNNVQIGVGRSIWGGTPPPPIPERVLDGIPGCAAWVALLFCIASAVAFPQALLALAAILGAYTVIRMVIMCAANLYGLRLIRRWERVNWYARYCEDVAQRGAQDVMAWEQVRHLVLIPNYKEPIPILRRTLENLAQQYEAKKRITVVLAMEAGEQDCDKKAEQLMAEYSDRFANFFYSIHPSGLPGEMRGKSSNEAWAARWAKREIIDVLGYNIDHVIVSTMDADTLWHKDYFYALTYHFAVSPQRYTTLWQSPIRYHGNIWEINPLLRIVNAYSSAYELGYLALEMFQPMPMSSYSISLRMLEGSGYWDPDVIAEDWHMFIKAFFASGAEMRIVPLFLPFLATATTGDNLWEAAKNRYQQTLRHAWGSKEVGYIIAKMLEHPELPFMPSLRLLMRAAHDILLAGAGWVIITVGSQLPVILNPGILPPFLDIVREPLRHPVPALLLLSGATVIVVGALFWVQDVILRPPRTRPATLGDRILTMLSFPLLPVLTLIFLALPVLQAQTRLLVGVPLQYKVARKL